MEIGKIKNLTRDWCAITDKVIEFENPDIKEIQRLFKETYGLLHKYKKEKFVPKQISGLLLEMHGFGWWVSDLNDTPIHYLYQEIVALICDLNRCFLIGTANAEKMESAIDKLDKVIND